MMRRSALFLALSVIFLFSTANAADAPRPLTPVQGGPSIQVDASLPWAPDRVLVKFTAAGLADSHLDKPAQKAAAPPAWPASTRPWPKWTSPGSMPPMTKCAT